MERGVGRSEKQNTARRCTRAATEMRRKREEVMIKKKTFKGVHSQKAAIPGAGSKLPGTGEISLLKPLIRERGRREVWVRMTGRQKRTEAAAECRYQGGFMEQ